MADRDHHYEYEYDADTKSVLVWSAISGKSFTLAKRAGDEVTAKRLAREHFRKLCQLSRQTEPLKAVWLRGGLLTARVDLSYA